MAAVIQSLRKLEQVVDNLEGAMDTLDARHTGTQRDMFGGPDMALDADGRPKGPIVSSLPDAQAIARRLDFAINKVEELLQEEEA